MTPPDPTALPPTPAAPAAPVDPSSADPDAPARPLRTRSLQLLGGLCLLGGVVLSHYHEEVHQLAAIGLHAASAVMHWSAIHILLRVGKWPPGAGPLSPTSA